MIFLSITDYILIYILSVVLINLYVFVRNNIYSSNNKKQTDYPLMIILLLLTKYTNGSLKGIGIILFIFLSMPFLNLVILYLLLLDKTFLETDKEIDYDLILSDQTIKMFSKFLYDNKIKFKKNFLNNNIKYAVILAFRNYAFYLYDNNQSKVNLTSLEFNSILQTKLEIKKDIPKELLELIEKDVLEYYKYKEPFSSLKITIENENMNIVLEDKKTEPKAYKRETIVFEADI